MKAKHDLLRRQQATQATLDRFRGKAFSWAEGITCVHMARFHLRKLGHRCERLPRLRTAIAARRALDQRGWADCAALLAGQAGLVRTAPLAMMMGDLVALPSECGFGAIAICAGPQKIFGWRDDAGELVVLDVTLEQLGELGACFRG